MVTAKKIDDSTAELTKAFQVALMKERHFDAHMPALRVRAVHGLHVVLHDALSMLHREGKLSAAPMRLDEIQATIYAPVAPVRSIREIMIPSIDDVVVDPHLRPFVFKLLTETLELYGSYVHVTLRLALHLGMPRNLHNPSAIDVIRASDDPAIVGLQFRQKIHSAGLSVNLQHRLVGMRRSLDATEELIDAADKVKRQIEAVPRRASRPQRALRH